VVGVEVEILILVEVVVVEQVVIEIHTQQKLLVAVEVQNQV
jgi:hypothetical protein